MNLYFSREIRQNDALRGAYNALTERTFGFSFEAWYRMGYWGDFHVPYALFDGGRAVANVSVNRMEVLFDGAVRQCFQLGTVMTDPACRRRGYARRLVEIPCSCLPTGASWIFIPGSAFRKGSSTGFPCARRRPPGWGNSWI